MGERIVIEPWFKDVAEALGYAKPLNALSTHIDEDDSLKQGLIDSIGRNQTPVFIKEYRRDFLRK